ncbi:hypothetical protein AB1Y20_016144 [Prymnesium parvum]|uniref:Uncharacterized protein n=1 Tax=Prymnesium parvum TaxID=97485 RepID=A0AB34K0H3_PRYPA
MVTARCACAGLWCVCVLPLRVALRSSAQLLVAVYACCAFLLALVPLSLSLLLSLSDATRGALAPSLVAQLLFVGGGAMLASACAVFCATLSPPAHAASRRSLCAMLLLTLLALATLASATLASDGLRKAFEVAFDECEPVAYETSEVRAICLRTHPESECHRLPEGYLGVFCKAVPGPYSADTALAFYDPTETAIRHFRSELGALTAANRFAAWLNRMCMPDLAEAAALYAELRADGWTEPAAEPGSGAAEGGNANASAFAQCYAAGWWPPPPLVRAPPFNATRYPNGSLIAAAAEEGPALSRGRGRAPPTGDAELFRLLHALGPGRPFNAKLAYCLCARLADAAAQVRPDRPAAWRGLSLGAGVCFLLLALLAQTYLCCYSRLRTSRLYTGDGRTAAQVEEEKIEQQTFLARDEVDDFTVNISL